MAEVASQVDIAWQDELWIGRTSGENTTWTQILGIETLNTPERVPEDIDVTHMQSPGRTRETVPGLMAAADWTQEKQMWPGDDGDILLDTLAALSEGGEAEDVQVEFNVGGIRRTYRGHVVQYTPTATVGEKRMANVAIKVFDRISPNPRVPSGS